MRESAQFTRGSGRGACETMGLWNVGRQVLYSQGPFYTELINP